MSFHIALTLSITHDYWGDETPPLKIVPSPGRPFADLGLIAKPFAAGIDIVAETALLTEPLQLSLDVLSDDPDLVLLTDVPDWGHVPKAVLEQTDGQILLHDVLKNTDSPRVPGDPFLQLRVDISPKSMRTHRLRLPAVRAFWAYHITGDKVEAPLQITDKSQTHAFEDLGTTPLPKGGVARVIRSAQPIALRRRSDLRLTLEESQDAPFDPITLVPVLPAAGANLRPAAGLAAGSPLQSDIFVSLW